MPVTADVNGPAALQGITIDLSGPGFKQVTLTGAQEVPPVATDNQAVASFAYNIVTRELSYSVKVTVAAATTLKTSHIHLGAAGVNGAVLYPLFVVPVDVTDTYTYSGW